MADVVQDLIIGTLFNNRYRLEAELGKGGMGIVYRAQDTLLDRLVAVKILTNTGLGSEGRIRLLNEARAAARLNHPNIVSIYDAGEAYGSSFIIMELLEGDSLFDHKPANLDETLAIMQQVCKALEHAHTHGIIHRDLKPENVILSKGIVKLTDFGLARSISSRVSAEGTIIGTIFYMAPEQALSREIDGRTDLYALGAMLYEFVTGQLPFTADDPLAVISQHLYAPVIPPNTYNPAIPPALNNLIVQLLSKSPDDRPVSAAVVRQALKDVAEGIVAPSEATSRFSPLDQLVRGRLVGREREFAEARLLWKEVVSGNGERRVLFISGESGVGKTPLVREIRALAEISGATVLNSECYAEGNAPYAPVIEIIRQALSRPVVNLSDLALADLITLAPDLRARYPQVQVMQSFDPVSDQQRLFESVVALCAEMSAGRPLMLIVEDIQWSDGGTLFLLRYIARRSRSAKLPLMLVLTYRDTDLDTSCCLQDVLLDLNRERLAARLKLTRFDREQTRSLLSTMFQEEINPEFVDAIYRETEGNMFFIQELCKALIEQGKLRREEGHWQMTGIEGIQLPQSVWLTIQARVGKLPSDAQDVLRLAAVIGREFDFDTLHKACELGEDVLVDMLESAERAQLIREIKPRGIERGTNGREMFAFEHGLIRTALRENVSGLRRHRLHRRVAQAIETLRPDDFEALAYHYEQAHMTDRAQHYYILAGDRALAIFANQEAEKYYRAAEDLAEESGDHARLLAQLGEALFRQSKYAEAVKVWQEGIRLYKSALDFDRAAWLYARTGRAAWYTGDPPKGLEICLEGMTAIPENLESPGMAALLHETARAYRFNNKSDDALPLCQKALEMAERLGLAEVQAETLSTMGILENQPREVRRENLTKAVELSESAGLLATACRTHLNLAGHLQDAEELVSARKHYLRAHELAQKLGVALWAHDHLGGAADVSLQLGDFSAVDEALPVMRRLLAAIPTPGHAIFFIPSIESRLNFFRGRFDDALQIIQTFEEQARQSKNDYFLSHAAMTRVEIYTELKQYDQAESYVSQVYDQIKPGKHEEKLGPLYFLTIIKVGQGDLETAASRLAELQAIVAEKHTQLGAAICCWTEGLLAAARRQWDDALTAFDALKATLNEEQMNMRWYRARATLDVIDTLIQRGQSDDLAEARRLCLETQAVFQTLKADYFAGLCQEKLTLIAAR